MVKWFNCSKNFENQTGRTQENDQNFKYIDYIVKSQENKSYFCFATKRPI